MQRKGVKEVEKTNLKDQMREITDKLEAGIKELFESSKYQEYLKTMSKFHEYSLNNTILISMQKPNATLVAGYKAWQNLHGRQVIKGEKAIKILAPAPYKVKVEQNKINAKTGKVELDIHGKPIKEIVEIQVPKFKVVNVFDIQQTQGRELPTLGSSELKGSVNKYELLFKALNETCPVPIAFEKITSSAKGYFSQQNQRIAIKEGMSQIQTIKTIIHEMAHEKLHNNENEKTRSSKEVEAESVAYVICQHFGIDTSDYSFSYIAAWSSGKQTPELKESLETIRKAASEMIVNIDEKIQQYTIEGQKTKTSVLSNLHQKQEQAKKQETHGKNQKQEVIK